MTGPSWAIRVRSALLGGWEPVPAEFIVRRSYYPWLVVGTTCIAAFIGQLDASIVQLTLPTLEHDFVARLSVVSWVAIAYQLGFASSLPVFARLAEIAGRKVMYLTGFVLFTLASALCGLASDLPQLVAFRVLQGIGGAMLGANSIVILVKAAGHGRQGRAMGIFAAAQAVGVSMGPLAGGVLLAALGWRWVFWVNLPFGLAAAVIGWLVIPRTTDLGSDRRFDWLGRNSADPGIDVRAAGDQRKLCLGSDLADNYRGRRRCCDSLIGVHAPGAPGAGAADRPRPVPYYRICRRHSGGRFVLRDAVRRVFSDVVRLGARLSRFAADGGNPAGDHPGGARDRRAVQRRAARAAGGAHGVAQRHGCVRGGPDPAVEGADRRRGEPRRAS